MSEINMTPAATPRTPDAAMTAHPDGRGRYDYSVSYHAGMVTLSLRHVERTWLPLPLFGRVVETKMVRVAGDDVRQMTLANDLAGLRCNVVRAGEAAEEINILGPMWPISMRERIRVDVDAALHRTSGGLSLKLRGRTSVVAALILAYAVVVGLSATQPAPGVLQAAGAQGPALMSPQVAQAPRLTPGEAASMSSAGVAQAAADAQANPLPIKEALGKASFITMRQSAPDGRNLIVWSDPLCPNCRDFDQKMIAKLPASVGMTVIPVSFKHGSRPLVSYAACAATAPERATRWKNLMAENPTGIDISQQCEAGPAVADSNTTLFARAGLRATPTLMKADGQAFTGNLHSAEEIAAWLAK